MRRCLDCGSPATGSRCVGCARRRKAWRNSETGRCRETVAAHRSELGNWCPGFGVPAHEASDLTADHVVAGSTGRLVVLCRSCNARKGKS